MKRIFSIILFTIALSSKSIEKPIVVIIPSYNNEQWCVQNIHSAARQNYSNYRIIYIDDCSTDQTHEIIRQYSVTNAQEHKITLIHNEQRHGALENLYNAIHSCPDYEIIVTLDGDDWFAHENVLQRVNQEYQNDAWLTYGQFVFYPSMKLGFCHTIPEDVIRNNAFKSYSWATSHLRTFYAGLFKKIKKEDLMVNGHFYEVTWDQAMLLPMLEMAGSHSRFIPDVLYIYNYDNPLNDEKTSLPLVLDYLKQIRQKLSYDPLESLVIYGPDLIIFSYDRPLQLYALLESIKKNMTGLNSITIMYRSSNEEFEKAYKKVHAAFPMAQLKKQYNPPHDFKQMLVECSSCSQSPYIMFAVDDMIIKESIDLNECCVLLEKYNAYGFYLRLGLNLDYCYSMQRAQPLPSHIKHDHNICLWKFRDGKDDWGYPHTVDMTIYRKADISKCLQNMPYWSPNTFEGEWAGQAHSILDRCGLCYNQTMVINIPINQVNQSPNVHMHWKDTHELLDVFNCGLKINIEPIQHIQNKSAHMAYIPEFISNN